MKTDPSVSVLRVYRVVCILEKLVDKTALIVLGDLRLLPDIFAQPLGAGPVDGEIFASDISEQIYVC